MRLTWVFFLVLISLFSCSKKKDLSTPLVIQNNYYPLRNGDFYLYQIKQSTYAIGARADTVFQLKVVFRNDTLASGDRAGYKVFRYFRRNSVSPYVLDSIWQASRSGDNQIIVTENNTAFLKLLYPLYEGKTWNGNAYNVNAPEQYQIVDFEKSWSVYSQTVSVIMKNDTNLLYRNYLKEVYAKDMGLVKRELRKLQFTIRNESGKVKSDILEGIIQSQELIEHGTE